MKSNVFVEAMIFVRTIVSPFEAYPVDSGTSICGRLGGKAFALGFLGFSRLMMSQYVVGTWLEARPSRVSNDAWR